MDDIETFILQHLSKESGREIQANESLALVGVDSVTMAELTYLLEKQFGIHVDDDVIDIDSVDELAAYVRKRLPKAPD